MNIDKPTGGDGEPDRFSGREDRPFPGAPENHEPAPELPKNTLSMEEVRAIHQKSGSNAEFEAAAKAHAQAQAAGSDSSAQDSPAPGSAGEGPVEAAGDGAAPGVRPAVQDGDAAGTMDPRTELPVGWQPEGVARPEGANRPDLDLPPFPGAPEDREAVPAAPDSPPSMEDVRAMHQRASSNTEFEAMVAEYAAAQEDAAAPEPGRGQAIDDPHGLLGRAGDLQDQEAVESAEPEGEERTGPGTRANTDTPQQTERGEETGGEKAGEGQSEDSQEQRSKDLAPVQHPGPDTETDRSAEASAEAALDQQPDDPRIAVMERQMERMMASVDALQEKLEASEARSDALEARTVELKQELDELKMSQAARRPDAGKLAKDAEQPEYRDSSDGAEASEHRAALGLGDETDPAGTGLVDERAAAGNSRDEFLVQDETERRGYTEETKKVLTSGWGLIKAAGVSVPGADLVLGGQETREAFEKLPADEQHQVMRMGETAGLAFSSMPPEAAVVALGLSLAGPAISEKFADFADRWRRKD